MSKRHRYDRRRMRRSARALFDKFHASLEAQSSTTLPAADTSPFGRPLACIDDILAPFSAEALPLIPPRSGKDHFSGLLHLATAERHPSAMPSHAAAEIPTNAEGYPYIHCGFGPRDMGLLAWTQDPAISQTAITLTAQGVYLTRIRFCEQLTISEVFVNLRARGNRSRGRNKKSAKLCCALYDENGALIARGESVSITFSSSGKAMPPQRLPFSGAVTLEAGIYTLALYCQKISAKIAICAASQYCASAFLLNGEGYRSAYSRIRHKNLPQQLSWAEFRPGYNYWFGVR